VIVPEGSGADLGGVLVLLRDSVTSAIAPKDGRLQINFRSGITVDVPVSAA